MADFKKSASIIQPQPALEVWNIGLCSVEQPKFSDGRRKGRSQKERRWMKDGREKEGT